MQLVFLIITFNELLCYEHLILCEYIVILMANIWQVLYPIISGNGIFVKECIPYLYRLVCRGLILLLERLDLFYHLITLVQSYYLQLHTWLTIFYVKNSSFQRDRIIIFA
jgi:hypothetical protein